MKRVRILIPLVVVSVLVGVVAPAAAQTVPVATPLHQFGWDIDLQVAGQAYEVAIDGQPYGPVLGAACTAATQGFRCAGDLPHASLTAGRHTAVLRSTAVVNGTTQVSAPSPELIFDYLPVMPVPTNPRIEPRPPADGAGVAVVGTIQQRFPMGNLDVAGAWLDVGAPIYIGAQQLSVPGGYTVQPGDRLGVVLWRQPTP
ncbi:MAG: hypothetical protein AB7Q16_17995 [Vicinamibacterales bacterium]